MIVKLNEDYHSDLSNEIYNYYSKSWLKKSIRKILRKYGSKPYADPSEEDFYSTMTTDQMEAALKEIKNLVEKSLRVAQMIVEELKKDYYEVKIKPIHDSDVQINFKDKEGNESEAWFNIWDSRGQVGVVVNHKLERIPIPRSISDEDLSEEILKVINILLKEKE